MNDYGIFSDFKRFGVCAGGGAFDHVCHQPEVGALEHHGHDMALGLRLLGYDFRPR